MKPESVFIYPSLGGAFSMNRFLSGVIVGLEYHGIPYEIVQPKGSGFKSKYIDYPIKAWRRRKQEGRHLVISERYAYLLPFMSDNSIVVCHDLHTLYNEAKTPKVHQLLYRHFLRQMSRAKKVVCVSEHTRNDLLNYIPIFKNHPQVEVVYNGIEDFWSYQNEETIDNPRLVGLFERYKILLSVGTDTWYKNNQWSLRFLSELPSEFHLLRVGDFNPTNRRLIKKLNLDGRITEVQDISDRELKFCYQNATALLFPSMTEGFGWPALEAALSGCTVISDGYGATQEVFNETNELIPLNEAKDFLKNRRGVKNDVPRVILWQDQVLKLLD